MTLKTDQCSICLDSTPYSECPGRQCQHLAKALKAKEELVDAYVELESHTERAEKALEEEREHNRALQSWNTHWKLAATSEDIDAKDVIKYIQRAEKAEAALEEAKRRIAELESWVRGER